jgi:acyl-coenzyme A thioesterase PaaI-like protein
MHPKRGHDGQTTQLPHVLRLRHRESIGLHLAFYTDDEGRCIARFRPKPEHQGFPGQLRGGLISTLLDVPSQISVLPRVLAV